MFSPGGFDGTLEKWTTAGVYAKHATLAVRYLEECLPRAVYWDVLPAEQTEANAPARLLQFLDKASAAAR